MWKFTCNNNPKPNGTFVWCGMEKGKDLTKDSVFIEESVPKKIKENFEKRAQRKKAVIL